MDRHELWIRKDEWMQSNSMGSVCDLTSEDATTNEIIPCEWIEAENGWRILIKVYEKTKKTRPSHHVLDQPYIEISTLPRYQTDGDFVQNVLDARVMFLKGRGLEENTSVLQCETPISAVKCPRQYKFYVQYSSMDPSVGKAVQMVNVV